MKPGIYEDMGNTDYHQASGWSTTNLKQAKMSVSVAENRALFSYDSQAFDLGRAAHLMVLEPEKFGDRVALMPKLNLRTNAGKEEKEKFYKENGHKLILSDDEYEKVKAMSESVNTIYGPTLAGCQPEVSVFAEDPTHGIIRKCRPDSICIKRKTIFDLKHTKDDFYWFGKKALFDLDYDLQAAWYIDTCRLAGIEIDNFAFIVVSNSKPYYPFGYVATEDFLESGREKYQKILTKIMAKREQNIDSLFHETVTPEWRQAQMASV